MALAVIAAVLSVGVSITFAEGPSVASGASPEQQQIVERLGVPAAFTIAYIPLGARRSSNLVRTEIWYYPEHGESISFVAGRPVSVENATDLEVSATPPRLVPWHIDDTTPRSLIDSGSPAVRAPLALTPEAGRNTDVYASDDTIYVIEHGRVVFISTYDRAAEE